MRRLNFKNRNTVMLVIFCFAFIFRISLLFIAYHYPERTLTNDSLSYIEPAKYLLRNGAYTHPSALRTPVYPLFLAIIYGLFGESQFYVVLVQVIIGLLTIYMTYKLSCEIFPTSKNITGILLLSFGLESILSPFFVMTETLFTFLLVCVLLCFLIYRRSTKYVWLVACGVFTGLSILCRPIALYFPVIIFSLLILEYRYSYKQWLKAGVTYVFVVALCVIPWVGRNYRVAGVPVVSTITGGSLLFYSANALVAHQQQIDFFDAQEEMHLAFERAMEDANLPNTERNSYYMKVSMARQIIRKEPIIYLYIHMRDSLKVFLPGTASLWNMLGQPSRGPDLWELLKAHGLVPALREYFKQTDGIQLLLFPFVTLLFVTCLGGFIGALVLFVNNRWFELMVLSLTIAYLVILSGPASYSRFRIPLMPFLSILAGTGLIFINEKIGRKNK